MYGFWIKVLKGTACLGNLLCTKDFFIISLLFYILMCVSGVDGCTHFHGADNSGVTLSTIWPQKLSGTKAVSTRWAISSLPILKLWYPQIISIF